MSSNKSDDLSPYERQRIENIKRNAQFLATLGFTQSGAGSGAGSSSPAAAKPKEPSTKRDTSSKRKREPRSPVQQTRYPLRARRAVNYSESAAASNAQAAITESKPTAIEDEDEEEDDDGTIDYEFIPHSPELLDDFEFEVYVSFKAWRLAKSRELEIEAYKVFHNDTLSDMIRRKRNNAYWGSRVGRDGATRSDADVAAELTESRGVGPSKSRFEPQEGLAVVALREVLEAEANVALLESSRKVSASAPEGGGSATAESSSGSSVDAAVDVAKKEHDTGDEEDASAAALQ